MINGRTNGVINDQLAKELKEKLNQLDNLNEIKETPPPLKPRYAWPDKLTVEQRQLLGYGIQEARQKKGITQAELNRLCKFTKSNYMCLIEQGKVARLPLEIVKKIGFQLKNDFNELIETVCAPVLVKPEPVVKKLKPAFVPKPLPFGLSNKKEEERVDIASHILNGGLRETSDELVCSTAQTFKVTGADFMLTWNVDHEIFIFEIDNQTIYKNNMANKSTFIKALKKIIEMVE